MSRRIRKHANPFNVTTRLGRVDRAAIFGRTAPVEIDLGCGGAKLLFERARNHPDLDFMGLEVRRPVVELAMARKVKEGPSNVVVFYANAHGNLEDLVEPGGVRMFHIHFPDPCFKKKHRKRRILQPPLVRRMAELLPVGGVVYAQSDVRPLAEEMAHFLSHESAFEGRILERDEHPIPERTEWELQHEREGEPVYRMWFAKVREPSGPVHGYDLRDTRPPELRREGEAEETE
ncbi:MAG: tRNA (guanosine(46)-N7)-methyltransferase TrmB [Myxococcota bacterium]